MVTKGNKYDVESDVEFIELKPLLQVETMALLVAQIDLGLWAT